MRLLAKYVGNFLEQRTNNRKAIGKGKRVNRGAGYGLKGDNDSSAPWLREQFERTGPVSRRIASCYHIYTC